MAHRRARPVPSSSPRERSGVNGNARLTGSLGAVLIILLAVEGVTIVSIHGLLSPHVFVGTLLIPPVLLKMGSAGWRFLKYYAKDPDYRRKGPPAQLLRLLGPLVIVLTVVVLASGVALLLVPASMRSFLQQLHKASFVLWFAAMTVHVLGHLVETVQIAPRDWLRRTHGQVAGASARQWALVASLAAGVLAAMVVLPYATGWRITG
jgi:succinate dehydrogenase hydrophobic anchor subunit